MKPYIGPQDPEEVEAEAALAFCEAIQSYDTEKELLFSSWVNMCISWHLQRWARNLPEKCLSLDAVMTNRTSEGEDGGATLGDLLISPETASDDAEASAIQDQLSEALETALEGLTQGQREVIRANFMDGKTIVKLAEEWGVSRQAVQGQKDKAMEQLRRKSGKMLRPFLDAEDDIRYSQGIQGTGINSFNYSWTSATERTALGILEHDRKTGQDQLPG